MAACSDRLVVLLFILGSSLTAKAQFGSTFAYTGEDALRSQQNVHYAHFGGFANSIAFDRDRLIHPFLISLFYEMDYLIKPANETINASLNVTPEIFLNVLFMGRVAGTADLLLFNEATNKPGPGFGLRLGGGYSVLGSTFDLVESSPILRAGFSISNIRATYTYSTRRDIVVNHQIAVGIKFDW